LTVAIKPELGISIVALILSVIATISSIYFSYSGLKTNVLPALVFVYSTTEGWSLRNVGNGPALNVVVAHQPHGVSGWKDPTRLYPISQGQGVPIHWVGHNPDRLVATYTDAHNRPYRSITDDDLTEIKNGEMREPWNKSDLKRIWERR